MKKITLLAVAFVAITFASCKKKEFVRVLVHLMLQDQFHLHKK